MKTPSRFLPAYVPEPVTNREKVLGHGFVLLIVGGLGYWIWSQPGILALLAGMVCFGGFLHWQHNRDLQKPAALRTTESICTFARGFDRKAVDTWIIRAVYEELQAYVKYPGGSCPIRAADRFEKDFHVDPEEMEELLPVIAQRTGRSTDDTESNPYFGKVSTIGDLVHFINCQPRTST
jgi:hypothetical protein